MECFNTDALAETAEVKWKGKTFICIKPTTYMNLSGKPLNIGWIKKKFRLKIH